MWGYEVIFILDDFVIFGLRVCNMRGLCLGCVLCDYCE